MMGHVRGGVAGAATVRRQGDHDAGGVGTLRPLALGLGMDAAGLAVGRSPVKGLVALLAFGGGIDGDGAERVDGGAAVDVIVGEGVRQPELARDLADGGAALAVGLEHVGAVGGPFGGLELGDAAAHLLDLSEKMVVLAFEGAQGVGRHVVLDFGGLGGRARDEVLLRGAELGKGLHAVTWD